MPAQFIQESPQKLDIMFAPGDFLGPITIQNVDTETGLAANMVGWTFDSTMWSADRSLQVSPFVFVTTATASGVLGFQGAPLVSPMLGLRYPYEIKATDLGGQTVTLVRGYIITA